LTEYVLDALAHLHDGRPLIAALKCGCIPIAQSRAETRHRAWCPTKNELSHFSLLWHDGYVNEEQRWAKISRPKYKRAGQRYASDLSDAEWPVIEPHMPAAKHLEGRPRGTDLCAVVDAIPYVAQAGCHWRLLPKDFPPFTTVQSYSTTGETTLWTWPTPLRSTSAQGRGRKSADIECSGVAAAGFRA